MKSLQEEIPMLLKKAMQIQNQDKVAKTLNLLLKDFQSQLSSHDEIKISFYWNIDLRDYNYNIDCDNISFIDKIIFLLSNDRG